MCRLQVDRISFFLVLDSVYGEFMTFGQYSAPIEYGFSTFDFIFGLGLFRVTNANANTRRPTLRLDLTVTSGATHVPRWHGVHTVLPTTHTFIHEWNEPSCMHFVSIHEMASPEQGGAHLDQLTTHLSTPKG